LPPATAADSVIHLQALAGNRAVDDLIQADRQAPARGYAPMTIAQRAAAVASPQTRSVADMTPGERLWKAMLEAPIGPALIEKLKEALNPEALAIGIGLIVGVQLIPVAWVAELVGVALAAIFLGPALVKAIGNLWTFAEGRNAQTPEELTKASQAFADAITEIGVDTVIAVVMHRISTKVRADLQKPPLPPPTNRVVLMNAADGSLVPVLVDTVPARVAAELGLRNEPLPGKSPHAEALPEKPGSPKVDAGEPIVLEPDEVEPATSGPGRNSLDGLRERAKTDRAAAEELVNRYDVTKDRILWKRADAGDETAQAILRQRIEEIVRELAPADAEAALPQVRGYTRMTDSALWKKAAKGDEMAVAVLRKRAQVELRAARTSDHRPPHQAGAVARDANGKIVWHDELTSGETTAGEAATGRPNASHTEARAVKRELPRGGSLWITGQYDPCPACQADMRAAAKAAGCLINYWWPGGPRGGMTFPP
jgi:hypothetical protein